MLWFSDPRFMIGATLFLLGMAINIHSDSVLRSLRAPGETTYKIPYGTHNSYSTFVNMFTLQETFTWAARFCISMLCMIHMSQVACSSMCLVLTTLERVWSGRGMLLHAGLWLEHTLLSGLSCSSAPELCSTTSKSCSLGAVYFFLFNLPQVLFGQV